jgi:hypothetical protein
MRPFTNGSPIFEIEINDFFEIGEGHLLLPRPRRNPIWMVQIVDNAATEGQLKDVVCATVGPFRDRPFGISMVVNLVQFSLRICEHSNPLTGITVDDLMGA